jgi:hypothetical protein
MRVTRRVLERRKNVMLKWNSRASADSFKDAITSSVSAPSNRKNSK